MTEWCSEIFQIFFETQSRTVRVNVRIFTDQLLVALLGKIYNDEINLRRLNIIFKMELKTNILLNSIKALVNELGDSSSSSTDNETDILIGRKPLPRVKRFVEHKVNKYSDEEFKKNFHISRELSQYLVDKYAASSWHIKRNYKGGRLQTPAEAHVLAFLWFAANKTTFREVANLFDAIRFPKETHEKEGISKDFENIAGFPNVLGCIAGIFIKSRKTKPKVRNSDTNRHDSVCITLQGICDAKLRFLDVFTSVPSKIHDAVDRDLSSACAPHYHLLGDLAYPLTEYLLTPYRDYESHTEAQIIYNTKLHKTRVKVENAYALLKARFCQLTRLDFHNAKSMEKFVIACCALHNLCIEGNDWFDYNDANKTKEDNYKSFAGSNSTEQIITQCGQHKRNDIRNQFYTWY
ncbi:putative nuclease HARBI1 [Eurosta solidaginis]|uniref:putative nuclease HARBI1 n=1 Tax=Eurosta solidaginis TaxID=178769 RepID=UPI003531701B